MSCFGRGTPWRDHLLVIAVLCKSLSVGTDPTGDEQLTIPFPNKFPVITSSLCSPTCASTITEDSIANPEFGGNDPGCPPEKLDEAGDTGGVSLGVTSPDIPDGIPKFPATLRLPLACLYILWGSCRHMVGVVVTACLHFLGGGCRENVDVPGDEKEGAGGVFEPGVVQEELASGMEVDMSGASRSFDIFKSDAVIITGALVDRRLGAGEPCLGTCESGRGSEWDGEKQESVEDLLRSIVRRLVPAALKESSRCPGG